MPGAPLPIVRVVGAARVPDWLHWHLAPLRALGWTVEARESWPKARTDTASPQESLCIVLDAGLFWSLPGRVRARAVLADPLTVPAASDAVDRRVSALVAQATGWSAAADAGRFREWAASLAAQRLALVGPGPRAGEPGPGAPAILVGGAVLKPELVAACQPVAVVAADGGGHLGGTPTARVFAKRVQSVLRAHPGCRYVVPGWAVPLLRAHWPAGFHSRILGVPEGAGLPPGHTLAREWAYSPTGNVLTGLALPLAAGLLELGGGTALDLRGITVGQGTDAPARFSHSASLAGAAAQARWVAPLRRINPAATQRLPGHMATHLARLQRHLAALASRGIAVRVDGRGWEPPSPLPPVPEPPGWRVQLFARVAELEHREGAVVAALFALALLAITLGSSLMPLDTLAVLLLAALVAGVGALALFLRRRVSRESARLERQLSERLAQSEAEIHARLRALETGEVPPNADDASLG